MDPDHDGARIVESLPSKSHTHSLDGLRALQENLADGFWATACGSRSPRRRARQAASRSPPRRRSARRAALHFAALTITDKLIEQEPEIAVAAVRAIVATQKALKADPSLAKKVGDELFPGDEADTIPILVGRDAPFYDATITAEAVDGLNTPQWPMVCWRSRSRTKR